MTVPAYSFGLSAGSSLGFGTSIDLGKALPVGRDLELDPDTSDLKVTAGDLTLVADVPAVRQEAEIRLRLFQGEWFLDTTLGVPYFQNVLVKAPNLNAIKSIFSDEILKTAGVNNLKTLDLDYSPGSRTLEVTWSADTELGELTEVTTDLEQG